MLLLTSNGLSSERLMRAAGQHIVPGRAALIVTADPEYRAQNRHVPRLTQELQLVCTPSLAIIDEYSPEMNTVPPNRPDRPGIGRLPHSAPLQPVSDPLRTL